MHARVTMYAGPADRVDDGIRSVEGTTYVLRQLAGFHGGYLLVDRQRGRAMTMTLWATEQAAEASAERATQIRGEVQEGAYLSIESIDTYEVAIEIQPG